MLRAIESVVKDESFHLPVEPATTALAQAKAVLEWSSQPSNHHALNSFEKQIEAELQTCLPTGRVAVRSFQSKKEDM